MGDKEIEAQALIAVVEKAISDAESAYWCRRRLDKSCYEVFFTKPDWYGHPGQGDVIAKAGNDTAAFELVTHYRREFIIRAVSHVMPRKDDERLREALEVIRERTGSQMDYGSDSDHIQFCYVTAVNALKHLKSVSENNQFKNVLEIIAAQEPKTAESRDGESVGNFYEVMLARQALSKKESENERD